MSIVQLENGERVLPWREVERTIRIATENLTQAFRNLSRAAARAGRQISKAQRRWEIKSRQVEGASYGVPVILHNGRKPTARRRP